MAEVHLRRLPKEVVDKPPGLVLAVGVVLALALWRLVLVVAAGRLALPLGSDSVSGRPLVGVDLLFGRLAFGCRGVCLRMSWCLRPPQLRVAAFLPKFASSQTT